MNSKSPGSQHKNQSKMMAPAVRTSHGLNHNFQNFPWRNSTTDAEAIVTGHAYGQSTGRYNGSASASIQTARTAEVVSKGGSVPD